MSLINFRPLFFESNIATPQLLELIFRARELPDVDILDFAESGATVSREMGLPVLQGADEIVVDRAELQLRAGEKEMQVQFTPHPSPDGNGVMLSLASPARLTKVEISYSKQDPDPRVVVRSAPASGSTQPGPPIYAYPPYDAPGPMFSKVLDGMTVTPIITSDTSQTRKMLILPAVLGSSWIIQLATGDNVAGLTPAHVDITIHSVTIQSLPQNLNVTLSADGADQLLWSHPGLLLPDVGNQNVSFSPLAQKRLTKALKNSASATTLTLSLKVHSDSGCAVEVSSKILKAQYVVKPLPTDPFLLQMRGDWAPLDLQALAKTTTADSKLRITAKLLGREMNAGTPDPPLDVPSSGLKVNQNTWIAAAYPFLPLASSPAGSVLNLTNVRLFLGTQESGSSEDSGSGKAEVVLEIHNDVASSPGPMVGSPVVRQIAPGPARWEEFELPKPLPVSTGQAKLWLVLRSNNREVLWFTAADENASPAVSLSADRGKTWGAPALDLAAVGRPLAQLFHPAPDVQPSPTVQVRYGGVILNSNLLGTAASKPPNQFVADGISLPASMLSQLASASGHGRVDTTFHVFSRTVADLKLEGLQLFYDPFSTPTGGA